MTEGVAIAEIAQAADALEEEGRACKRNAAWNRRRARLLMQRAAELREFCERAGIQIRYVQAPGGTDDD